jgi:hypothetical protein
VQQFGLKLAVAGSFGMLQGSTKDIVFVTEPKKNKTYFGYMVCYLELLLLVDYICCKHLILMYFRPFHEQ